MTEDNESTVWYAIGRLTYAEMISFVGALRDVSDDLGLVVADVSSWAEIVNSAREAFEARDIHA